MRPVFSFLLFLAAVPAFATIDTGLLSLAPASTKMVSGIDVSRAKASPFGQYILEKMNTDDRGFEQFIQATGFDPRRDVEDVVFVSAGASGDDGNAGFGVLVRGNFDQERIRKTFLTKGGSVQRFQGVDVLIDKSDQDRTAFAFIEVDVAVMGDLSSVHQMIANRANPATLDPALEQLISTVGADHDAWFASLGAGSFLAKNFGNMGQAGGQRMNAEALQSILESSGGISFGDVVQLSFDAVARSPKDATSLADVVRFGASIIQMQRQQNTGANMLASSLDNMTMKTDGSHVHIALSVPEASLEQLAESKGHHSGSNSMPTSRSPQ